LTTHIATLSEADCLYLLTCIHSNADNTPVNTSILNRYPNKSTLRDKLTDYSTSDLVKFIKTLDLSPNDVSKNGDPYHRDDDDNDDDNEDDDEDDSYTSDE
jgi:hypothetical protein